jgi:pyrroline-5-carboxylate reductase
MNTSSFSSTTSSSTTTHRLAGLKVGFLGVGNLGQALVSSLLSSRTLLPKQIFATNRSEGKLQKVAETFGIQTFQNNEELVETCDLLVVAVKPQDLFDALEPLVSFFNEGQIVMSLAAGVPIESLQKILPNVQNIVRVMPNTPSTIHQGVIGYCLSEGAESIESVVEDFLEPLGYVVAVEEGLQFDALTVAAASGTGFIYELMLYWQEWLEEHDFDSEAAEQIVLQTFLGSAMLAAQSRDVGLQDLQDKVVSKKGVTFAGLESMRELEVERALRYSFEKAVLRARQLGQSVRERRKTQNQK